MLDQPTQSQPPAAYFPSPGDAIVVGIVDVREYHQRDYDTGDLKYWPDGGAVKGKVVTGLVVSTEGGTQAGTEKAHSPVAAGDYVSFFCEGGKHYTYRDALTEAGGIDVGYVMRWVREADEPATNPRHAPRKVYTARIRPAEPRDGDLADRCRTARESLLRTQLDAAPEPEQPSTVDAPF